jgi:diguanylate cyclase (GGDEF)-like protein
LTQLPNRRLLQDRLRQAITGSVRSRCHGAVIFIDLDHFKTLNDTLGHHVGDMLLVEVAHRLQDSVREGDTVTRLGGDEFVVMLEGLNVVAKQAAIEAKNVGKKIRTRLNQPYFLQEHEYVISSSIGITLFCGNAHHAEELLEQADMAMYQAKTAGRNTLRIFKPSMRKHVKVEGVAILN